MPTLLDLLFGNDVEVGIINPAIKKFLIAIFWQSTENQFNKYVSEEEAIAIRVRVRDFNEAAADLDKDKEQYKALMKNFIRPFIGAVADNLVENFTDINCLELKKFSLLTRIQNHRLRTLLIDFAIKNTNLSNNSQKQFIQFEPTLEQIVKLNQSIHCLTSPPTQEAITLVLQTAFGKSLHEIKIVMDNKFNPRVVITPIDLTLQIIIDKTYTSNKQSLSVNEVSSIVNSALCLNYLNDIFFELILQKHAVANPLFGQGLKESDFAILIEQVLLVPYDDDSERYARRIDQVLQQVTGGLFAQTKFNGQGIPKIFFSGNGPVSNFKNDLHRLAMTNLIFEPTLRNVLRKYIFLTPKLKISRADIKLLNKLLNELNVANTVEQAAQQVQIVIQEVWPYFKNPEIENFKETASEDQLQLIYQEHQRVKPIYLITEDFLKAQLLFFAFADTGKNFRPSELEVNLFMNLIGNAAANKISSFSNIISNFVSNHLLIRELEKIAQIVWPFVSFKMDIGILSNLYEESKRTQIFYLVTRPEIRTALFYYANLPEGKNFYPTLKQIQALNDLIDEKAVLNCKSVNDFNDLLKQSGIISKTNFFNIDLMQTQGIKVLAEADRLRPLYRIYFAPLRDMLIQYAYMDSDFSCTSMQIKQLNDLVLADEFFNDFEKQYLQLANSFEEIEINGNFLSGIDQEAYQKIKSIRAYQLIANCFARIIQEVYGDDVAANFVKQAKIMESINLQKPEFLQFSVSKFSKNLVATQWFNQYVNGAVVLEEWFAQTPNIRDFFINNLIQHYTHKKSFETKISKLIFKGNFSNLKYFYTVLKGTLLNLNENHELEFDSFPPEVLKDFAALAIYKYFHTCLFEFNQPLVKQALIASWRTNLPSKYFMNSLTRSLEPILKMLDSDSIVECLANIFTTGSDESKKLFKQSLLTDVSEGGGGLNAIDRILCLKGQVRLYQLKGLGLKSYANFILSSCDSINLVHNQNNLLQKLGSLTHSAWIEYLLNLITEKDDFLIATSHKLSFEIETKNLLQRVQALFYIEREQLRLALFDFAFSSVGKKISFTSDEVSLLNKLINDNALLGLDTAEVFDNLIHHIWPAASAIDLFHNRGVISSRIELVLAEAERLRALTLVEVPGLRKYLTKIALAIPRFNDWREEKIMELNRWLALVPALTCINFFSLSEQIFKKLWPDLDKERNDLLKYFNIYLDDAVDSCHKLLLAIMILNELLLPLDSMKRLFVKYVAERDIAIHKLASIIKQGEVVTKLFLENFWQEINKKLGNTAITQEEKYANIFKFLQQQFGVDQYIFIENLKDDDGEEFFAELSLTASYWGLVALLKEKLIDFGFLYKPKIVTTLIRYGQENQLFDPDLVAKQLEPILHMNLDVDKICNLLAETFAPGSKEFNSVLKASLDEGSANLNVEINIVILKGQLRLAEFKAVFFARWLNNCGQICRYEALQKIGAFDDAQWIAWQTSMIRKLASAKNNIDILKLIIDDVEVGLMKDIAVFDSHMNTTIYLAEAILSQETIEIIHYEFQKLDENMTIEIIDEAKRINSMMSLRSSIRYLAISNNNSQSLNTSEKNVSLNFSGKQSQQLAPEVMSELKNRLSTKISSEHLESQTTENNTNEISTAPEQRPSY